MSDDLAKNIKDSIQGMQESMQSTYAELGNIQIVGTSKDETVKVTMTATYVFVDIDFNESALQGGVREFKRRIKEAWENLSERIQETTQSRTMELLQGMDIPDEIRNIADKSDEE